MRSVGHYRAALLTLYLRLSLASLNLENNNLGKYVTFLLHRVYLA